MVQATRRPITSRWWQLWTTIPVPNRRWVIVNAFGVTAIINVVVNFPIAWLGTRGAHAVALWAMPLQRPSTIADTLGTTFVLPFVTAITCSAAVGREIRLGRVPPLPHDCDAGRLLNRLPRRAVPRAMRLASLTLVGIGPVALLALAAVRFGNVSVSSFLLFKVAYAVGLGLVVTPVIALAAMLQREGPLQAMRPPGSRGPVGRLELSSLSTISD